MPIQLHEDGSSILLWGDNVACCLGDIKWDLSVYFPRTGNQGPCVNNTFGGLTVTNNTGVTCDLKCKTSVFVDDLLLVDGSPAAVGPQHCAYDSEGNLLCCDSGAHTISACTTLKSNIPDGGSVTLVGVNHFAIARITGWIQLYPV
jgi:hypothetical protein